MSNYGVHSGQIKAKNIQTQLVTINTDGSGYGHTIVNYKRATKNVPIIIAMAQEPDMTGTFYASNITSSSCDITVDGSAKTSDTLSVGVLIIDQYE